MTLYKLITAVWVSRLRAFKTFIFVQGLTEQLNCHTQFCIKDFIWLD